MSAGRIYIGYALIKKIEIYVLPWALLPISHGGHVIPILVLLLNARNNNTQNKKTNNSMTHQPLEMFIPKLRICIIIVVIALTISILD